MTHADATPLAITPAVAEALRREHARSRAALAQAEVAHAQALAAVRDARAAAERARVQARDAGTGGLGECARTAHLRAHAAIRVAEERAERAAAHVHGCADEARRRGCMCVGLDRLATRTARSRADAQARAAQEVCDWHGRARLRQ